MQSYHFCTALKDKIFCIRPFWDREKLQLSVSFDHPVVRVLTWALAVQGNPIKKVMDWMDGAPGQFEHNHMHKIKNGQNTNTTCIHKCKCNIFKNTDSITKVKLFVENK